MARRGSTDREDLARIVTLVGGSTLVLTASLVGVLALINGAPVGSRLPGYVLAMAVAFVVAVFLTEQHMNDSGRIIAKAGAIAFGMFVVVTLCSEGVIYVVEDPDGILASQLLLYFLAAGLIGTGLGYWGVRHWQEFVAAGSRL